MISRRDFLPFGQEIPNNEKPGHSSSLRISALGYSADDVRQKFTGYQKDEESGLDFAEARMYNNRHARFTAVDPLLASGKSANPQTFNRYVYVMNSPLNFTDPTGLQIATYTGPVYASDKLKQFAVGGKPKDGEFRKVKVKDPYWTSVVWKGNDHRARVFNNRLEIYERIRTRDLPAPVDPKPVTVIGDPLTSGPTGYGPETNSEFIQSMAEEGPKKAKIAAVAGATGVLIGSGVGGIMYATGVGAGGLTTLGLTEGATGAGTSVITQAIPTAVTTGGTAAVTNPDKTSRVINEIQIQFGRVANQVYHTFRHTDKLGLDRVEVRTAIETHLRTVSDQIQPGSPFIQTITIAGEKIQYTAYQLADGTVNIGRIHGVN